MTEIVYTHRTRAGNKARIICDNLVKVNYPIVAAIVGHNNQEFVCTLTNSLKFMHNNEDHVLDLTEYCPWDDVAVDTPILVSNSQNGPWFKRHFAKYEKTGIVFCFMDGLSSWTNSSFDAALTGWKYAKLPEKK